MAVDKNGTTIELGDTLKVVGKYKYVENGDLNGKTVGIEFTCTINGVVYKEIVPFKPECVEKVS